MKMIRVSRLREWSAVYKLYQQAFPACERKPFRLIFSMHKQGTVDVWYFEKEGTFVGFAITLNGDSFILLDYLAVAPKQRSGGIGSAILSALQKQYAGKGLVIEIESVYADTEDKEERIRRKQFYLKNGLVPQNVMIFLFGVEMELLCIGCSVTYQQYFEFYYSHFGKRAEENIRESTYPKFS